MKKSTEITLIISTLIVCLAIFVGGFLYLKHIIPQEKLLIFPTETELQQIIDKYIQNHQYDDSLAYLSDFLKTKDNKQLGLVNYYLALTKYQRLNYLSEGSMWEQYHAYNDIYLKDILDETNITLISLSKTEYALSAQYLKYWVYNQLYLKPKKKESFETFIDMLNNYCQDNKECVIAKDYALMLYENNDLQNAKEIGNLYIKYLNQNLPHNTLMTELKLYANAIFDQGKHRIAMDIYMQYLGLKINQDDESAAILATKDVLIKYMEAEQFTEAREFAELAMDSYPNSNLEDYFQLQLALCLFETKEVRKSKEIYYRLLNEYPDTKYKDEALCQLLDEVKFYSYRDRPAALKEIESLKKYTTNSITKAYLIITTAETYYLDGQYDKAIDKYNLLLDTYPESVLVLHAEKKIKECKELSN
jgi:tetratricopeptide (TPR) repeat protein